MTATANRTRTGRAAPRLARAHGFTYLGLIILVTVIGLVGAASLKVGSLMQRAAAEEELLAIGAAFSDALRSYAAATPPGQPQQPPTLQELLKDPRFPGTRRHLRKIFVDPITGKAEWGVMYVGDKQGVLGVYSLSDAPPLKVGNFDARFLNMENKSKLSEWKFTLSTLTMTPQEPMTVPGQSQPGQPAPLFPPADAAAKPADQMAPPPVPAPAPAQEPAAEAAMTPPEEPQPEPQPEKAEPPADKPDEPVEPPEEDQSGKNGQESAGQDEPKRDERQRDDGRRNEPKREM
ncbi:type II secretion system protein [Massilia mucilaginosa]|uniref:type II secretion system protein n=1 Tax=Massilia mucilaginosa TaxID=2609282 RepID=UPI001E57117E|nr:type II secretion system protein [Massilia mucilaginosa]